MYTIITGLSGGEPVEKCFYNHTAQPHLFQVIILGICCMQRKVRNSTLKSISSVPQCEFLLRIITFESFNYKTMLHSRNGLYKIFWC